VRSRMTAEASSCLARGTPEIGLNDQRIPILLDSGVSCPIEGLKERIDGFNTISDLVNGSPGVDEKAVTDFLAAQVEAGTAVWRHEWSPLRWCQRCGLPLLQDRCDTCGSAAGERIELKFPCNPRPALPHDEFMFRAVGLPWPVGLWLIINGYRRPDYMGWELIHHGVHIGDIVCPEGNDDLRFLPSESYDPKALESDRHPVTMADVADANRTHCDAAEQEAVDFIREWCTKGRRTLAVASFSGGKDSAVLAHLCHRSGVKMRVVQIDTGIDPPGNREYSAQLLSQFRNLKCTRIENGDMFWHAMEKLGPPSMDFQWCRAVLKNTTRYRSRTFRLLNLLGYAAKIVKLRSVFVDGPRRREEEWRITLKRVAPVRSVPIETITIRPMLDFTDLDIWMYFHRHSLPVNPTYVRDKHQRLLCMFCPDQGRHEFEVTRRSSPEAWARFENELKRWQGVFGFPDEWVRENLWTREAPDSRRMRDLRIRPRLDLVARRLNSVVQLGELVRHRDRWTVAGRIVARFHPAGVARWLQPFGSVRSADGRTTVKLFDPKAFITVSPVGELALSGSDRETVEGLSELFRDWLVSYLNCIGCGACRATFKRVTLRKGRVVMRRGCRAGLDGVREAVLACPVNARGARDCSRLRQDV
jgi:3'-phosphoadenosine 5'-phosphosulfate sulfotransferase (PAPS reductase)/FAD synthetase